MYETINNSLTEAVLKIDFSIYEHSESLESIGIHEHRHTDNSYSQVMNINFYLLNLL